MHEYFEILAKVVREHGYESLLEAPEHEVDTPRHFICTRPWKLGPITLWPGRRVAEILSEGFGGSVVDDREPPHPLEMALAYDGLRIHVFSPLHHKRLKTIEEHLRQVLREPVTED